MQARQVGNKTTFAFYSHVIGWFYFVCGLIGVCWCCHRLVCKIWTNMWRYAFFYFISALLFLFYLAVVSVQQGAVKMTKWDTTQRLFRKKA